MVDVRGLFLAHEKQWEKSFFLGEDSWIGSFFRGLSSKVNLLYIARAVIQIRCQKWLASWNHRWLSHCFLSLPLALLGLTFRLCFGFFGCFRSKSQKFLFKFFLGLDKFEKYFNRYFSYPNWILQITTKLWSSEFFKAFKKRKVHTNFKLH